MAVTLRRWPRRLAAQLALLLAVALFVAQAISFTLLLRERRSLLLEQISGPAIARLNDAIERSANGRIPPHERGRVRRMAVNPVTHGLPRITGVETLIREGLVESGHPVGRIITGIRPFNPAAVSGGAIRSTNC